MGVQTRILLYDDLPNEKTDIAFNPYISKTSVLNVEPYHPHRTENSDNFYLKNFPKKSGPIDLKLKP